MKIDFSKNNGLVPAIIQNMDNGKVLMLGYMNEAALSRTLKTKKVTFYSRSRKRLWVKGETSGNHLHLHHIEKDCDGDTLLLLARPSGPVCHTGEETCFSNLGPQSLNFLNKLETIISERKKSSKPDSYTSHLFSKGIAKIAQKIGEEATEVVIESIQENKKKLKEETADLLYHLLVMLAWFNISLADINTVLASRHQQQEKE